MELSDYIFIKGKEHEEESIQRGPDRGHSNAEAKRPNSCSITREHGISEATFYNWRQRYGGMEVSEFKRMKDLEEENRRLKKRPPLRMYAELSLEHEVVKEALKEKRAAWRW